MHSHTKDVSFWDKAAAKYALSPIGDMTSYTYTLERTRSYLGAGDEVVELGCGTGSTALLLAPSVRAYHGTDISPEMIKIARRKLAQEDIDTLSFEAHPALKGIEAHRGLDAVLAFNLLHLVRDIPATLAAAHDALKPGGLLITKTVCMRDSSLKYRAVMKVLPLAQMMGKAPFVQSLRVAEYDAMIEAAGFEVVETGNHPANPPARYVVARKI